MKNLFNVLLCFVLISLTVTVNAARTTIPFWHSFAGHLGQTLDDLCDEFNQSQNKYTILPIYKGSYAETLTSFVAAFRAGKQPPLVQIFEIGTQTMLHPKGIIKPVYELLNNASTPSVSSASFLRGIRNYYSDKKGRLLALPFNSSSAVLFYNKNIFLKAGIMTAPLTWDEVKRDATIILNKKLAPCGMTTTFPSWIQIETFLNWHGLAYADKDHGQEKLSIHLDYSSKALQYHLKQLAQWQESHIFEYGGRDSSAVALFSSGHCAILTQSSGAYIGLKKMLPFELGVSSLPYWPKYRLREHSTVIGGAALWVISGFEKKVYQGVKTFLTFLANADTQSRWQRLTGYLPVTEQARQLSNTHVQKGALEASNIALAQMQGDGKGSQGARLGYYAQIRLFNDEQIEAICAGSKSVKQALHEAQDHANYLLRRFEKNVSIGSAS